MCSVESKSMLFCTPIQYPICILHPPTPISTMHCTLFHVLHCGCITCADYYAELLASMYIMVIGVSLHTFAKSHFNGAPHPTPAKLTSALQCKMHPISGLCIMHPCKFASTMAFCIQCKTHQVFCVVHWFALNLVLHIDMYCMFVL